MAVKKVPAKPHIRCKMGEKCLYADALKLHEAYRRALKNDTKLLKKWQQRLKMARFVKAVAENAAKSDPDVWENLLVADKSSKASSFANSFLRSDIQDLEEEITATIEAKAKALVDFLKREDFQKHLVRFHRHHVLEDYSIYDDPALYVQDLLATPMFATWRHMDHCLAVLTDQLAASKTGYKFLEEFLIQDPPEEADAFDNFLKHAKKAKSLGGPLSKFFYNVSPVVVTRIQRAIHQKKLLTTQSVLDDPEVKEVLSKLSAKLAIPHANLNAWITKRATDFSGRIAKSEVSDLKKLVDTFDDLAEQDFDAVAAAKNKLNTAWLRVGFGTIAFYASLAPMMDKLAAKKKLNAKDWMGLVDSMASFAQTIAELKEADDILKGANGNIVDSASAARFAKTCGVAAGIAGIVISLMEVDAALQSRDAEKIILTWTGAVVGVSGFVATIISATLVSGVLTVVGVALAVASAILLREDPAAPYLAKTPWGTDQLTPWGIDTTKAMHVSQVIEEYYTTFFDLSIAVSTPKNDPHIKIYSHALSEAVPVWVTIRSEKGSASKAAKIRPGDDSVAGKGTVTFNKEGDNPLIDTDPPVLAIHRPWEIWPMIEKDGDIEYTLTAEMDVDQNGQAELTAEASDVTFPPLYNELARHLDYYSLDPMFEDATHGSIYYPENGYIQLNVYAKFTRGCKVNVFAEWDESDVQDGDTGSETHPRNVKDAYDTFEKTTIDVRVGRPKDGSYEVELRWVLLNPDGKKVDEMDATIRILPS